MAARQDHLTFKYGQPLFAAAWPCTDIILVAGGGGRPGTGIENRIIAAAFRQGVLTDELASVRLKSACVKMAVSQSTNLVLAVTDKGIVPYNLKLEEGGVPHFIMPQASIIDAFSALSDRITAIRFSDDGELLVMGSAAGVIHIWSAAQLKSVGTHSIETGTVSDDSEIKDVHISDVDSDDSTVQIVATTDGGACHVLAVSLTPSCTSPTTCKVKSTCTLSKPSPLQNGSARHCRFVGNHVICTVNYKGKGYLCRWQQVTQGLFKFKRASGAVPAAITGMDMNTSGDMTGLVNAEGHTLLLDTTTLKVRYRNKKAHMVFGTDVAFSSDIDAYVSVSGDASARITLVPQKRSGGGTRLLLLLLLVLLSVAFLYRDHQLLAPFTEQLHQTIKTISSEASSVLSRQGAKIGAV